MSGKVSRRDFLKAGGAGLAGVALSTLGIGTVLGKESVPDTGQEKIMEELMYVCPICQEKAEDFPSLQKHFQEKHSELEVPSSMILHINGADVEVYVEDHWTLRETLLRAVGLTGNAKEMCDRGGCGSCTVLIDGVPALACTTLVVECNGKEIETSEGIAADPTYRPLVEAYVKYDASQCGYCTPGQFTVAKYILTKYPDPTEEQIRTELSGNICRCGTYSRHVQAIQEAASVMRGGKQ